jgi:mRNA interferase RelE/StbE
MSNWTVVLTKKAINQLDSLDAKITMRIRRYVHERLEVAEDPRKLGTYLVDSGGLYRFRVGDYRLIASIDENTVTILILKVGHRSEIYKR